MVLPQKRSLSAQLKKFHCFFQNIAAVIGMYVHYINLQECRCEKPCQQLVTAPKE